VVEEPAKSQGSLDGKMNRSFQIGANTVAVGSSFVLAPAGGGDSQSDFRKK